MMLLLMMSWKISNSFPSIWSAMEIVRAIIFDIDGVLVYQGRVYPGAIDTIQELRRRGITLRFLTNSTLKSRQSAADKLNAKGFHILPQEVITASSATAEYLRRLKPRSCWVMLEREGLDEFKDLPQDEDNPEYVVVGDNRSRFDFDHLNKALRLLCQGSKLVGMQAELLDSSMGELELNVGAWVKMLELASGVPAVYIGKPNPFAFELALDTIGLPKDQVLVVGDRLSTDVQGARDFGLRSVLVRTGEFHHEDLDGSLQPDVVIDSIDALLNVLE
jgi:HAD superfamily hydrolase (TIGR01458 family)